MCTVVIVDHRVVAPKIEKCESIWESWTHCKRVFLPTKLSREGIEPQTSVLPVHKKSLTAKNICRCQPQNKQVVSHIVGVQAFEALTLPATHSNFTCVLRKIRVRDAEGAGICTITTIVRCLCVNVVCFNCGNQQSNPKYILYAIHRAPDFLSTI